MAPQASSECDDGDEILQDAREKLREGLRLVGDGSMMAGGRKLSPRRLFEYLDSDGFGEVSTLIRVLCDSAPHFLWLYR